MERRPWIVVLLVMFFGLFGAANAGAVVYDEWNWESEDTTDGMEHWQWSTSGTGAYEDLTAICQIPFATCGSPNQYPTLLSSIDEDEPLSAGSKGEWKYEVPGGPDAYIASADFQWIYSTPSPVASPGEPHPYFELAGGSGVVSSFLPSMITGQIDDKILTGGSAATEFRFGLTTPSALTTHPAKATGLLGAKIRLADAVDPVTDFDPGDVPSGWINGPIDIPVEAEDNGLGVIAVFALGEKENPSGPGDHFIAGSNLGCVGNSDSPCPAETPSGYEIELDPAELPDGTNDLIMYSRDADENMSNGGLGDPFQLKVDKTGPGFGELGSFFEAGGIMTEDSYSLDLEFVDPHSGVASAEMKIDDVVVDADSQSCPGGGCSLELEGVFDTDSYSNGTHTMEITTVDIAGNLLNGEFDFEVDR